MLFSMNDPHKLIVNSYVNYGFPDGAEVAPEVFIRSIDVENGGELYVNKQDEVGSLNYPLGQPQAHSHFTMNTDLYGCHHSHVRILNGGTFHIGDWMDIHNNTASVHFNENAILEIMPGGKLIVNKNSQLIIERGATLIFHPGAIIELNGKDAVLEIKGKVDVRDNAVFTYTYQNPNDFGHLVFNQRQWDGGNEIPVSEYWEIGDGAQFVLEGSAEHEDLLMHCKRNFRTTSGSLPRFSLFKVENGMVEIDEYINANFTADSLSLEGVLVNKSPSTNSNHNGLQMWGMNRNNASIINNVFKGGLHCVHAYQIGSQYPIEFENCLFENNDTSMVVYNGSFELIECEMQSSLMGVYSKNALGVSRATKSFFQVPVGIRVEADMSAKLYVHDCEFIGDTSLVQYGGAVYGSYTDVRSTCSDYSSYFMAIGVANAMLDVGDLAVNNFSMNNFAVYSTSAIGVNLKNGENTFTGNTHDLWGFVPDLQFTPTVNINGSTMINALNNQQFSAPVLFGRLGISHSNPPIYHWVHSAPSFEFVPLCGNGLGVELQNPFELILTNSGVDIGVLVEGISFSFTDALLYVTENVYGNEDYESHILSTIYDLQLVIDQVGEHINSSMSSDVKTAYHIAIKMNLDLLRVAYNLGLLEVAGGDPGAPMNPYVSNLSQYIQTLVGAIDGSTPQDDEERAGYDITRAHVYRLAEHHQHGISVLSNLYGNYSTDMQDRIDFWLCVMSWEKEALIGNISPEELEENVISCYMMFNPHIGQTSEDNSYKDKESSKQYKKLNIYPNPTSEFIYFRSEGIANLDDELMITITDSKGKQVYFNIETASYVMRTDVSSLAQGSYILTVATPKKRHNATFTVVR